MKKLKLLFGVAFYFIIVFALAFMFINCSGKVHKHAPKCMTYKNSYPIEQPKKFSKFKGKTPTHYKVRKHK